MKILSFVHNGMPGVGILNGNGVVDLRRRANVSSLRALLESGGLASVESHATDEPDFSLQDVRFLQVVTDPRHVICVGINYSKHIDEAVDAGIDRKKPDMPSIFLRVAESLVAHGEPLLLPAVSRCLDYEGELAVIIGKGGRYIAAKDAQAHVAGYACFNDGSIRDWQFHTNNITPGKNFPGTGALGPWLVSADEIPDPHRLRIRTRVDNEIMQDGNTTDMIFKVPEIIAYISSFIPLAPGDVITTGTPEGVGFSRKPPRYLEAGETCEIEIEGIGTLVNPVATETV